MKTKEILCILLIILALLIPTVVKAEDSDTELGTPTEETEKLEEDEEELTWTDISNLKVEVVKDSSVGRVSYKIEVTGATELKNHTYYTFITNGATEPELIYGRNNQINEIELDYAYYGISTKTLSSNINKYIERNGDMYYWLLEEQRDSKTDQYVNKFIVSRRKIERPEQLALTKRITATFTKDDTFVTSHLPYDYNITRKAKVKVGQITDNTILLSLKNNESNALNKLLSYARTANSIYYDTLDLGELKRGVISSSNLIDNAYYYIYIELDDENGTYYPVEDVSFCQAYIDNAEKGEFRLTTYVSWNSFINDDGNNQQEESKDTTPPKDNTTASGTIPQTGEIYTILVSVIVLITVASVFAYKYNRYKGIK